MKKEEKSLELSLIDTIESSEATEIIKHSGEIAIDSLLEDGLFKDIPIIGSLIALGKTAIRVSDYLFIKKVFRFIQSLENISEYEKCEEWKRIQEDKKYANHIGETIILILDRLDSLDKPALVAKVCSSYLKGEINYSTFQSLSSAIEKTSIADLNSLFFYLSKDGPKAFYSNNTTVPEELCERLYISGLGGIKFDRETLEKQLGNSTSNLLARFKKVLVFDINPLAHTIAKIVNGENYYDWRQ